MVDFIREVLAIEVDTFLSSRRVILTLDRSKSQVGISSNIQQIKFTQKDLELWYLEKEINFHFIQPSKPIQIWYIGNFNKLNRKLILDP